MRKLVAVDFDGTVVRHEYPEIGATVEGAADVLRELVANGVDLILWTMRSGEYLDAAIKWFTDEQIPLFGVNGNPEQSDWTQSPKAYAQVYIDDAALGCPLRLFPTGRPAVDWDEVRTHLEAFGLL